MTTIATQHELVEPKLVPFFGPSQNQQLGPFSMLLPQAELNAADRPTISLTPQDDQDFTKRLFTPIPLDGVVYLSKTTWPISTVFRLWLENINWVSNAETASGPTPKTPPVFAEYLSGMEALQRLQDRKLVAFFSEEREEKFSEGLPTARLAGKEVLEAAKDGYEFRKDEKKDMWTLIKKKQQPILRFSSDAVKDADFIEFCRAFKLKQGLTTYELVADKADPFWRTLRKTASFISTSKRVRSCRCCSPVARYLGTGGASAVGPGADDAGARWPRIRLQQVLGGLFQVCHAKDTIARRMHVAIRYHDYWFSSTSAIAIRRRHLH